MTKPPHTQNCCESRHQHLKCRAVHLTTMFLRMCYISKYQKIWHVISHVILVLSWNYLAVKQPFAHAASSDLIIMLIEVLQIAILIEFCHFSHLDRSSWPSLWPLLVSYWLSSEWGQSSGWNWHLLKGFTTTRYCSIGSYMCVHSHTYRRSRIL